MNSVKENINGLFQTRMLQSDEYLNETDKLIYCSKCRTPRQCKIEHNGQFITLPIRCKCQRETDEQEEADYQKRQHLIQIERLKASGLQDRYLHDYTFANDQGYNPEEIMTTRQTGGLLWGYKPLLLTRVSRRGL